MSNGKGQKRKPSAAGKVAKGGANVILIWVVLLGVVLAALWIFGFSLDIFAGIVETIFSNLIGAFGVIADGFVRVILFILGLFFLPFEVLINVIGDVTRIIDAVLPGDVLPNIGAVDLSHDGLCSGSGWGPDNNACSP